MKNEYKKSLPRLLHLVTLLQQLDDNYTDGYSILDIAKLEDIPLSILRNDFYQLQVNHNLPYMLIQPPEAEETEAGLVYESIPKGGYKPYYMKGLLDEVKFILVAEDSTKYLSVRLSREEYSVLNDFLKETNFQSDTSFSASNLVSLPVKRSITDTSPGVYECIKQFNEQINKHKSFHFTYRAKSKQLRSITIEPLKILHDMVSNLFYLVTIDRNDLVFYRIDRIVGTPQYVKTEQRIQDFAPLEKLPLIWGMENSNPVHVRLKIYKDQEVNIADKVKKDLAPHMSAKNTLTESADSMIFEGDVCGYYAFLKWVRRYGSSMVILEPKRAVDDMLRSIQNRLSLYEQPS